MDQQWESQLINDAEFTANAQLPSVTFDVNNSYVSQQLGQRVGEEVSHFYHPTPPPRNPSGFWQRVEQRYKNEFERQALIAEGRAAANSEVMRESLGHAPANQQHYLDLGYTDSVAQYGAGWIGMAEVPAAKSIQLGKQATRLLVDNKWGFFGHSGTESSVANNSVNHISALRLQKQLAQEEVSAIFNSKGELSQAAIENSRRMPLKINNTELKQILSEHPGNLADGGKYETTPIHTDAGLARMHFYHNPVTGDLYYGMDYKAVFDHQGTWNLGLNPNFNYEPPRFNP